jgi:LysM repeat protein
MKRNIFLFLCLLYSLNSFSQIEISKEIQDFNGKPYYIHEVLQGQTVYSIAKKYGVTTDAVFEVNTFARDGIKTGQFLRIPYSGPAVSTTPITTTENPISEHKPDTIYLLTFVADEDLLIFQLSRRFNIEITDIINFNPDFAGKEIIRKNDIARLPLKSDDLLINYLLNKPHSQVIVLISHSVGKSETLYSISREYGCSVGELMSFNPGLDENIKPNQIIWVTAKEQFKFETATDQIPQPDCHVVKEKRHYNVALLVPFQLDKAGAIKIDSDPKKNLGKSFTSFDYIHFYEGFLLGLNNIDFNNATIKIHVYDVSGGDEKIGTLISRGVLDVDLIIGPFMRKPLEKLNEWSAKNNVKVFDLYLPDEIDYSLENPNLLSAIPSISEQLKGVLDYIKDFDSNKNVIVVYNENNNEKILADKIRDFQSKGLEFDIRFVSYGASGMSGLVKELNMDKNNVIISFTNNEVFLNNFLRSLFDNAEKYTITLFGLPSWLRFESIDLRYMNHFNTHFFSSQFVDYNNEHVKTFVSTFQQTYLTDPNRLAFLGYDIALYSLGLMTQYGRDFAYCTSNYSPQLLSTQFQFERQDETSQLQNVHVCIFEIIEYQLFDSRRTIQPQE